MSTPAERAAREAEDQGHPPRITDPTVLAAVATLLAHDRDVGDDDAS